MIETDSLHQPVVLSRVGAEELLSLCVDAEQEAWRADRRKLRYALHWALLHPASAEDIERGEVEPVGGEGTPAVEELTTDALAVAFGISSAAALGLVSDALELSHRLPLIWARLDELEVPAWRARRVAQATVGLTAAQAAAVDAEVAPIVGRCGARTLDRIIAEVAAAEDAEACADEEEAARANWDVKLFHPPTAGPGHWAGTSVLEITGDTAALTDLFHRINDAAVAAGRDTESGADPAPLGVRRAAAATALLGGTAQPAGPRLKLYLHASAADLLDETVTSIGTVERLGALTLARIREWCGAGRVTVQPVLHAAFVGADTIGAVDRHDPPAWMREQVVLRDRHCVFPGCQTDARSCDLDHIEPYLDPDRGGPPGQTSAANLACLCRRHHRAKTRRRWRYRRRDDGSYEWTGPFGLTRVVTVHRTRALPWSDGIG